ncbi:MAG: extracellular solute-binding protein [Oscillospiraceae bacterium]|nr:extracellular solute-binding protein [Oscillospiraceae bacterium]
MKKIVAVLLAAIMTVALAACGSSSSNSSTTSNSSDTTNTTSSSGSSDSLTVWCWDPAFNIYAMQEAEKVYQQTDPNFKLNIVETSWNDIQTKLTTAATANQLSTLPDIFLCQDNAFQKNVINYPEIFADLTGSGIAFDQFAAGKVAYSVIDGKNYGVPFDNGAAINCLRTDVLQQAGYKVDDFTNITWDKFITMGKDILAKTGKPLLSTDHTSPDLIMMMLQSAGASLFNADGSVNIANNAVLKEVIKVYQQLLSSGILTEVNSWDEYIATLVNGTVASTINGCWIIGSIQTAKDQSGKWGITNLPSLNVPNATNYSANGGSSWAISASSPNKDLAAKFLSATFAGSTQFYETILPSSGALATYLPAGQSTVYNQPSEFFGGQKIFSLITDFASKVPKNYTGVYYYEARDAVSVAISQIMGGIDVTKALQDAESTVKFKMGS